MKILLVCLYINYVELRTLATTVGLLALLLLVTDY